MKTKKYWISAAIISLVLAISLATLVYAQNPTDSQPNGSTAQSSEPTLVLANGNDSNPGGRAEVLIPDQYRPDLDNAANGVAEATVYFTPQDENTSTTVLFLYNTSGVAATVGIETFNLSGSPNINTSVSVPPNSLVRICGDTVSTISATWQDVVLINFTTLSTYAKMTLPEGVKADGYVVWNNGSTYDPLQVAPTLPLRFSVDPPTVFLPTIQKNN